MIFFYYIIYQKNFSLSKVFKNTSANFSKQIHHPRRWRFLCAYMLSLDILSKAQINLVQDASQEVTLHLPNSITKAIDGLFKYNGNRT